MPVLITCPLSRVGATLDASGATSVLSLLAPPYRLPPFPARVRRHLHLAFADIVVAQEGHQLAAASQVHEMLAFVSNWDRAEPLLIHCYAGVSRSTAAAMVALCALDPNRPEHEHAQALRRASPTATPNRHLIALADSILGRDGRVTAAIASLGRGAECFEGNVFALDVPDWSRRGASPGEIS